MEHHNSRSVAETLKFPFQELNLLIFSFQNLSTLMYEVMKCNRMFYSFFWRCRYNQHTTWVAHHCKWQLPHVTWHCLVVGMGDTRVTSHEPRQNLLWCGSGPNEGLLKTCIRYIHNQVLSSRSRLPCFHHPTMHSWRHSHVGTSLVWGSVMVWVHWGIWESTPGSVRSAPSDIMDLNWGGHGRGSGFWWRTEWQSHRAKQFLFQLAKFISTNNLDLLIITWYCHSVHPPRILIQHWLTTAMDLTMPSPAIPASPTSILHLDRDQVALVHHVISDADMCTMSSHALYFGHERRGPRWYWVPVGHFLRLMGYQPIQSHYTYNTLKWKARILLANRCCRSAIFVLSIIAAWWDSCLRSHRILSLE